MLKDMIFHIDDKSNESEQWEPILRRHISYFADEDGLKGLLKHLGEENPYFERVIELAASFDKENPRQPFERWHYVDIDFRDLIGKMTNLNPSKRITAEEALKHSWFQNIQNSY